MVEEEHRYSPHQFQSHCGSIGAGRLVGGGGWGYAAWFQSHYGSIGAPACRSRSRASPRVSIPLWFDWGNSHSEQRRHLQRLSIPLWFDWGGPACLRVQFVPALSIPLWFDWGLRSLAVRAWLRHPFNPTLVRLGHLGSEPVKVIVELLSIPLWFDWGPHPGRLPSV